MWVNFQLFTILSSPKSMTCLECQHWKVENPWSLQILPQNVQRKDVLSADTIQTSISQLAPTDCPLSLMHMLWLAHRHTHGCAPPTHTINKQLYTCNYKGTIYMSKGRKDLSGIQKVLDPLSRYIVSFRKEWTANTWYTRKERWKYCTQLRKSHNSSVSTYVKWSK